MSESESRRDKERALGRPDMSWPVVPRLGTTDADLSFDVPLNSAAMDHPDQGGDEETPDGLNALDEALRIAVEDEPVAPDGESLDDTVPVFDRGEAAPKI